MASKISSLALFLALNTLFFTLFASACETGCSSTTTPTSSSGSCPIDTLKLKVCANLLGGLLNVRLGQPATEPCCSLIQGLADLDAAVCLCTAIKANVLGINLNVPVDLSLLLNNCGYTLPRDFQCA